MQASRLPGCDVARLLAELCRGILRPTRLPRPQVHLADILRRAGFVPEQAQRAAALTGAALPPAFQEGAANPAGSIEQRGSTALRVTAEGVPAGAGAGVGGLVVAASSSNGTGAAVAPPAGSSGGGAAALGGEAWAAGASARTGLGDERRPGERGLIGAPPGGNGFAAANGAPVSSGTGVGAAGPARGAGEAPDAVSASALRLGAEAAAAPSSANAAAYGAPAAAGFEDFINENVAGFVARLNPAAADGAGALLTPEPNPGPPAREPDETADPAARPGAAPAAGALPLVPSGDEASAAAVAFAAARGRDPGLAPSAGAPAPRPSQRLGLRALRRVASTAAAVRRRRGFDPDFDRATLFLNPLRRATALARSAARAMVRFCGLRVSTHCSASTAPLDYAVDPMRWRIGHRRTATEPAGQPAASRARQGHACRADSAASASEPRPRQGPGGAGGARRGEPAGPAGAQGAPAAVRGQPHALRPVRPALPRLRALPARPQGAPRPPAPSLAVRRPRGRSAFSCMPCLGTPRPHCAGLPYTAPCPCARLGNVGGVSTSAAAMCCTQHPALAMQRSFQAQRPLCW